VTETVDDAGWVGGGAVPAQSHPETDGVHIKDEDKKKKMD
jgi:hypothetical protein